MITVPYLTGMLVKDVLKHFYLKFTRKGWYLSDSDLCNNITSSSTLRQQPLVLNRSYNLESPHTQKQVAFISTATVKISICKIVK